MNINNLPEKKVRSMFWRQVNVFLNSELYAPGTFDRKTYLDLYAVMYDNGWLTEDDLFFLDYEGLPED